MGVNVGRPLTRILVLTNEVELMRLARSILEPRGCVVRSNRLSGAPAANGPFDIVIVDLPTPVNVDSVGAWLTPQSTWTSDQSNFNTYVARAIAFREAHPALRPAAWYTSGEVAWYYSNAAQVSDDPTKDSYWNGANNYLAYTINGGDFADSSLYIIYNGASPYIGDIPAIETQFTLPPAPLGENWYRVADTCEWNDGPDAWAAPGSETLIGPGGSTYGLCGQALALFIAK